MRFGFQLLIVNHEMYLLGNVPELTSFNKTAIMEFVIVPTQPFNYLGVNYCKMLCVVHMKLEKN